MKTLFVYYGFEMLTDKQDVSINRFRPKQSECLYVLLHPRGNAH